MLIRDAADRVSRRAWLERRLFETVGRWSLAEEDPRIARALAAEAGHHAWRAAQLDGRMPVLHDVEPAEPGSDADLVAVVDAVSDPSDAGDRLVALAEVALPATIAGYEQDLAVASEVSDAPLIRVLRLVVTDARDDQRVLAALIHR